MGFGNVSERRSAPPQVGVSVVILALGPEGDTGNSAADSGNAANSAHSRLWLPLVKRVRQPFLGCWALPGGDLTLRQQAFHGTFIQVLYHAVQLLHPLPGFLQFLLSCAGLL